MRARDRRRRAPRAGTSSSGGGLIGVAALVLAVTAAVALPADPREAGAGRASRFGVGVAALPRAAHALVGARRARHAGPWSSRALAFLAPLQRAVERRPYRRCSAGRRLLAVRRDRSACCGLAPARRPSGCCWPARCVLAARGVALAPAAGRRRRPPGPADRRLRRHVRPVPPRAPRARARPRSRRTSGCSSSSRAARRTRQGATRPTTSTTASRMTRLGRRGAAAHGGARDRGAPPGPSYTVDTLDVLRKSHPPEARFRLLLGADSFQAFPTWHDWEGILDRADAAASPRVRAIDLEPPPEFEGRNAPVEVLEVAAHDASSSALRRDLRERPRRGDRLSPPVARTPRATVLYGTTAGSGARRRDERRRKRGDVRMGARRHAS